MTDLATYSRSGAVGTIVMDDGKANVMSLAMLNALHAAFDQAERDKTVVILKARGKHFSGGFDLNGVGVINTVPEPASLALLTGGLAGAGMILSRKRRPGSLGGVDS